MAGLITNLDVLYWLVPLLTLILGLIIGFLAQRSGFCSIGGMRDLFLFKHTRLFIGYLSLIASAFLSYMIFNAIITEAFPNFVLNGKTDLLKPLPGAPGGLTNNAYVILAIIGGFMMGLLGVILGGCPLRQTIMGFEGNLKSIFFIIGMCVGAILFHTYISPWVVSLFV